MRCGRVSVSTDVLLVLTKVSPSREVSLGERDLHHVGVGCVHGGACVAAV